MGQPPGKPLVIGISSRALLDLEKEDAVFQANLNVSRAVAVQKFIDYQREHQDEIIPKGVAFPLVRALLKLNETLSGQGLERVIEVVIISRNHPDCGLRILSSLAHHGLEVGQAAFTGGVPVLPELRMFNVDLFLSYEEQDVIDAGKAGISAAKIFGGPKDLLAEDAAPLLAFDGDSTIFSNESDLAYDRGKMREFALFEQMNADKLMEAGPLAPFFCALGALHAAGPIDNPPFRMVLVTSRNFHLMRRPMETLRGWGIQLDKSYAIGRMSKQKVLKDLNALMFFDNDAKHCAETAECTPTAHVLGSGLPTSVKRADVETNRKNSFILICRSYLKVKNGGTLTDFEQWFEKRVASKPDDTVTEFLREFETSAKETPVGHERPAKDAKNAKSAQLFDFLEDLSRKHFLS
jgi:5'-nucleotidase